MTRMMIPGLWTWNKEYGRLRHEVDDGGNCKSGQVELGLLYITAHIK
jgi:hypothetical protein